MRTLLDRRQLLNCFIRTVLFVGVFAGSCCLAEDLPKAEANIIQQENAKEGSTDWQLTRVRLDKSDGCRSPAIEGYCSKQSVAAGETLQIMVSTQPAERFKIEIFRTGYYGGRGARLMTTLGPFDGKPQPVPTPDERTLHECQWKASAELTIPRDWPSGVYLGRLTTLPPEDERPYWQSYVIFIVCDDRPADILFQCSDNTWQAYNGWPYKSSVYTHPKGGQGPWADVSFDRPYGREAQYSAIVNDPLSVGSGGYLTFEFPLAYWLEQQGYDVSYCSNSDLLTPDRGLKCKAFLSVGHDEYWDIRQYKSVVAMRDAGVNLLFLSGNSVCWVTPFKPSGDGRANRIIFRGGPYGGKYKWAEERERNHGPFPQRGPDEGYLMGARNLRPVNGGGDWICTKPDHWIFAGTGMKRGDRVPGLIGWEYHGDPPKDLPGLAIVGQGTAWQGGVNPSPWAATIYPGPKGNYVFNAATIFWAQGMSVPPGHTLPWSHWSRPHGPDKRIQQITRNLLTRAIDADRVAKESREFRAAMAAHHICSGLWVVGRSYKRTPEEVVAQDLAPFKVFGWEPDFKYDVDHERRSVTVAAPGAPPRTAVYNGDQGTTILPRGEKDVFYKPIPVPRGLPDAATQPWPMGDAGATEPIPDGVDINTVGAALDWAMEQKEQNTRALVVAYRGKIIGERYAPGWTKDTPQISWSQGKSITAALIGVLAQRGHLKLDQPAPIKEWQAEGDPRREIRIQDLLRMSSGLDFINLGLNGLPAFTTTNEHFRVYFDSLDVFEHAVNQPLKVAPNTRWSYLNSDPLTLGKIIRDTVKAQGEDYLTFPQRALFDRIGARNFVLETDAWGNFVLSGYDYGSARDWVRFGLLHLWGGVWQGERILPKRWVKFISTPAPAEPTEKYGGLFWLNRDAKMDRVPKDAYWSAGFMGQVTLVIPSRDLVVVRMGPSPADFYPYQNETVGRILKALPAPPTTND